MPITKAHPDELGRIGALHWHPTLFPARSPEHPARTSVPLPNRCCARPSSSALSSRSAAGVPAAGSSPYSAASSTRSPAHRLHYGPMVACAQTVMQYAEYHLSYARMLQIPGARAPPPASSPLTLCAFPATVWQWIALQATATRSHVPHAGKDAPHAGKAKMPGGHLPSDETQGSATGRWSPSGTHRLAERRRQAHTQKPCCVAFSAAPCLHARAA